ncbi:MAG: AbrB/MazE/SpoVT family DNA-binding domain-containing protein [Ignavibacteriae bacterium]|nr:AbrB/MazE/SpoVT family DNA-binding domain-containing protein [Ignavibacteriota bacterium]
MTIARVHRDGNKQSVELPEGFRIDDSEVYVKRVGNAIVLLSKTNPWQPLKESLNLFSDDFMDEREQPGQTERESFD